MINQAIQGQSNKVDLIKSPETYHEFFEGRGRFLKRMSKRPAGLRAPRKFHPLISVERS